MNRTGWERFVVAFSLLPILLGAARGAEAGEVTIFASASSPRDKWELGVGADLSLSFFRFAVFGVEMARQKSVPFDANMSYLTGHALLALPVKKRLTLYGGVGTGFFKQGVSPNQSGDFGLLSAVILGAKMRFEDVLVVKAEFRQFTLRGDPPVDLKQRVSLAAGLAF